MSAAECRDDCASHRRRRRRRRDRSLLSRLGPGASHPSPLWLRRAAVVSRVVHRPPHIASHRSQNPRRHRRVWNSPVAATAANTIDGRADPAVSTPPTLGASRVRRENSSSPRLSSAHSLTLVTALSSPQNVRPSRKPPARAL